jgi:hypothetical protein
MEQYTVCFKKCMAKTRYEKQIIENIWRSFTLLYKVFQNDCGVVAGFDNFSVLNFNAF